MYIPELSVRLMDLSYVLLYLCIYRWCVYYVMRICVNPKQVMVAIDRSQCRCRETEHMIAIYFLSVFIP